MFFELPQVQKIETNINTLTEIKQTLDRKCLDCFSSQPQRIQSSLKNTLQTVLSDSQKTLQVIKEIQDQVEMGYFVPSTLNVDDLVYDSSQLPEWFQFVFKKEYEKQKKNLDTLCKKAYKMQSLPQVRHNLEKEIQSFRLLVERYEILTHKEKTSLNIMGEAEIVTSKCKCSKEKYSNFCKSISTKIVTFLEQSVSKSMNFSNSMNSVGQTVINSFNVKLQPQTFERGYLTNKFKQTGNSFSTDQYQRQKMMRSVDFQGRSPINRLGNDLGRTTNEWGRLGNDLGRTTNEFGRYVPRHANQTLYDFYR